MTDEGRKADLAYLKNAYQSARTHEERARIHDAAKAIVNETKTIRSMRERLIKEVRAGRVDNVKDIHTYIKDKGKYKNE